MVDPMRGKYTQKGAFKAEFECAKKRLKHLGGEVTPGVHDYEAFIYRADGIRLIFYPHTVKGTGNRHIRVRSAANTDPKKLRAAIFALAENTCTFQYPADRQLHDEAVRAALKEGRLPHDCTEYAAQQKQSL